MTGVQDFSGGQSAILREIGVPVFWRLRSRAQQPETAPPPALATEAGLAQVAAPATALNPAPAPAVRTPAAPPEAAARPAPVPSAAPSALAAPAQAAQASAWDDGPAAPATPAAPALSAPAPSSAAPETDQRAQAIAQMDWLQLEQAVRTCRACPLGKGRTQAVFGVGDRQAQWLLVGEGPGRTEDALGEPFVGKSGKLLDNMLAALQLARGRNVYIANIVKCRPTDARGNDRAPTEFEAAACRPFLQRQISLLQPRVMLALGKTAAISLLQLDAQTPVSGLRARVHQFTLSGQGGSIPLVATYHPAYLLRSPTEKAKAWADLCLATQQMARPEPA
ncbi:uracil-DNA glycosylase [Massilia sp. W12]|uniref:uracil-DNA glycosylase n=1 Tax=Massilia sp. W12 TaxID=3126507 RepID=UPI0030D5EC53